MDNNQNKSFQFTYSAKEQEEIKAIRKKYIKTEEDKMSLLRRLDESVTQKATAFSLILGIVGTLILGSGMSMFMSDFGGILGRYSNLAMPLGIVLGIIGSILAACAFPAYNRVLKKEREKITPEILRLTDELLK